MNISWGGHTQNLTKKEIETIFKIANEGPLTGYDLHLGGLRNRGNRKAIMSNAHWLKVKKSLESPEKKLIKLLPKANKKYSGREYQDKRGRRKDIYDLTLLGWIVFFGLGDPESKHISRLVKTFKDYVPLVFGEWEYFKKEGVEEIAKKHLSNTLKICEFKYQMELLKIERGKKDLKNIKNLIVNERGLAYEITKTFLFNGFNEEILVEHKDLINEIPIEEIHKLEKVFDKHNKLYLFRFEKYKMQTLKSSLQNDKLFFSIILDSYKFEPELSALLRSKIDNANGVKSLDIKVVNSVFNDDYFEATINLCKMYQNFWFKSYNEIIEKIIKLMNKLAYMRIQDVIEKIDCDLNEIESKWDNELPKLRHRAIIEILAAFSLFKLQTTEVCYVPGINQNFGKLTLNIPFKKFEQNKKQAKAEAISITENYVNENKLPLDFIYSVDLKPIIKHLLTE